MEQTTFGEVEREKVICGSSLLVCYVEALELKKSLDFNFWFVTKNSKSIPVFLFGQLAATKSQLRSDPIFFLFNRALLCEKSTNFEHKKRKSKIINCKIHFLY